MKAEILNITPEMAKKMLEKNPFNRNISRRMGEKFAKPINDNAAARWEQYMCAQKMLHDFEQGKGNARPAMSKVEYYRSAYE